MKILALVLSIGLTGCATFESVDHVQQGSPRFFAGTRLDVAAITKNQETLDHFQKYEMEPPAYPKADFLASLAADVIVLPIAAGYTLTEPLLYLK